MQIEPYDESRLEAVVALSLRAWAPVFASIEAAMDTEVYRRQHPDWRETQKAAVEAVCGDPGVAVWVATDEGRTLGFTALQLHEDDRMGEIFMIAVDPDHQRRGIAGALTQHALGWFAEAGMTTVMVETGGDPGHAPARATYEAAGFRPLPTVKYFRTV